MMGEDDFGAYTSDDPRDYNTDALNAWKDYEADRAAELLDGYWTADDEGDVFHPFDSPQALRKALSAELFLRWEHELDKGARAYADYFLDHLLEAKAR